MQVEAILAVISISFFAVELFCFGLIKYRMENQDRVDIGLNELADMFGQITPHHLLAYAVGYGCVLMLGQRWPFVMTLLITLQLLSISFNLFILVRIQND